MTITDPEPVLFSAVYHPVVWPHGPTYFMVETSQNYFAATCPLIRDSAGKPMVLTEELGVGSIVQIAIGNDGMMTAIKIVQMEWADPFAVAA